MLAASKAGKFSRVKLVRVHVLKGSSLKTQGIYFCPCITWETCPGAMKDLVHTCLGPIGDLIYKELASVTTFTVTTGSKSNTSLLITQLEEYPEQNKQ